MVLTTSNKSYLVLNITDGTALYTSPASFLFYIWGIIINNKRYKMKKTTTFLLTALAAVLSFTALAQTTITGRIFNERGEGVEYATVSLEGDTIGTLADAQGHFNLTIPNGKNNNLVITHVSYDRASIPFSSYSVGKPLSIIVKDKNVKLDEVVIGKKNKMKTILGKKLPGPTASFRGKGQQNWLEWGPTFKAKKNWVVSDIFFTIKKSTYSRCVLSFTIYEIRGKEYVNILNKPIYKTVTKTTQKTKLAIQPNENVILKTGKQYYVSVTIVDSDESGMLEFNSQFRSCIARRLSTGKTRKLPAGPIITLSGYELSQ
jgi:hypothetical protein